MILKYFISFFLISALHLVAELISWNNISICTKPLLMPLLLVGIYGATNKKTRLAFPFRAAFVALIFSTAGDVFLLMEKGTHQELLAMNGLYANLYHTQFSQERGK